MDDLNTSKEPEQLNQAPIDRMALALFVVFSSSFLAPLLLHSSTLAIPAIVSEMQLTADTVSWFNLAQVLAAACFVLPAGKLSDRFGRRKILAYGIGICALGCFVGGFAVNGSMILFARALQGLGGSLLFASAVALIVSMPPKEQKVRVMGNYISITYIGVVSGPIFGGLIIEHFDWRWVFLIPGAILLVLTVLCSTMMQWERYGDRETRIRPLDVSLYIGALLLFAFGVYDAANLTGQLLVGVGLISLAVFCWFQSKRRDPLLQVKLFTNSRIFTILGLAHFLTYVSLFAMPFILTLFLQFLKGISPQVTGFILLVQAFCTVLIAPFSGWFALNFRTRNLIFCGAIMFVVATLILASLTLTSSVYLVVIAIALLGAGTGIMDAPIINTSMSTVSSNLLGSASATMNGLRTVGGFVGMGLVSFLMGIHLGEQTIEATVYPQLMQVIHQFFSMTALLSLATLALLTYGVVTMSKGQK